MEDEDVVGVGDGAETVRHRNGCPVVAHPLQRRLNCSFRVRVQRRCRFVQQNNLGLLAVVQHQARGTVSVVCRQLGTATLALKCAP